MAPAELWPQLPWLGLPLSGPGQLLLLVSCTVVPGCWCVSCSLDAGAVGCFAATACLSFDAAGAGRVAPDRGGGHVPDTCLRRFQHTAARLPQCRCGRW